MEKLKNTMLFSGVFKGLGRQGNWKHCKKLCFGTVLWRQMCKLPCFEGKHCKNMQTRFKKHGLWRILWKKNADKGAKCRLDSFSGHRRRGYLKFHSLGGLHAGEKIKKHPLGGSQGEGNRGPGLRMAAKLFEIEMQITCMHKCLKKNNSYVCKVLSPCHGPKKTCGVGGHPTRSGVNTSGRQLATAQMDAMNVD